MPWLSISALEVQFEKHSFRRSEVLNIPNKPVNLQGRATVKQGISKEELQYPSVFCEPSFTIFKTMAEMCCFRLQKL